MASAANWLKTASRKSVRGRVVIRDYLGLRRIERSILEVLVDS